MKPCYLDLYERGELDRRIEKLNEILTDCHLCPRDCRVNRAEGEKGYCKSAREILVSSIGPHFGEENELVGWGGSGTIFLSHCSLGCLYCQNFEISHLGQGKALSTEELARAMLHLQSIGCHNINFVTPTHFIPQIVGGIRIAIEKGLRVPIVYNCGGYEEARTLRLLERIVDIYMPDVKYSSSGPAKRFSNAPHYFEVCRKALKEMHRQVGDLKVNEEGIAERGLLIRHLVLPNNLAGSQAVLRFIAENLSKESYVNIMSQYRPRYKASLYPEITRGPRLSEINEVVETAEELGLHRGFSKRHLLIL
jgi:putative pyruvate formate lyase activating enzyme